MSWLNSYFQTLAGLVGDLWLYFLIGFLSAGVVAEFVPRKALMRYLGKNSVATMLRATLSGTVASLCSCGAIPIAVTMRKAGTSRAAALTFMLAAPWAGFMQLLIFHHFLGLTKTAVVFAGALSVAFLTGLSLGRLEDLGYLGEEGRSTEGLSCHASPQRVSFARRLVRALKEAREAFGELWKYLALGLLLAAVLKAFIPSATVAHYLGRQAPWNPVFTAVPVAAAVELCSEGFSIFAGQLHQQGATLAVVFVVVLVGVSTDFTELSVIFGKFGKRCAVAYVSIATILTLMFALLLQKIAI